MKRLFSRIHPYLTHLSDETLVDLVSGEVSSFGLLMANLHLLQCWQCRTRREDMEKAARVVVEFRKSTLAKCMPLDERHRRSFLARIENVVKPPVTDTFERKGTLRFLRIPAHMNPILASVLVITAATAILFYIWQSKVPVVSASELLHRAEASDQQFITRERTAGVLYRQVSITTRKTKIQHATYRDLEGIRRVRHCGLTSEQKEVHAQLDQAGVDWEEPLSAKSFLEWRESQQILRDEVRKIESGELTLTTWLDGGNVAQETFTVRLGDFHPIRRTIEMRNKETIEVAELNYAVLGWNAVNEKLFEPLQPTHAVSAPLPVVAAMPVVHVPTLAQLLDAEVQARVAVHSVGADLGEPVQVVFDPSDSTVQVSGMLGTDERRNEIATALRNIPNLSLNLQTVDEVTQATPLDGVVNASHMVVVDQQPVLEGKLMEHFPDEGQRSAFVNEALNAVDLAMAHAWAIHKLEDRYGSPQLNLLETSDRQMLQLLIRDHLTMIQKQIFSIHQSFGVLLDWPPDANRADAMSAAAEQDWHQSMSEMFTDIKTIQHEVRGLLTQSESGAESAESMASDLQRRLVALEDDLPSLSASATEAY